MDSRKGLGGALSALTMSRRASWTSPSTERDRSIFAVTTTIPLVAMPTALGADLKILVVGVRSSSKSALFNSQKSHVLGVNVIFHNWTHSNPVIRPGSTLVSYQDCRLVYLLFNSLVLGQYIHPHNRTHLGPVLRSASPLVLRPDFRLVYPSARRHLTASKSA